MAGLVSSLYHSGVGWLSDIIEGEVFIEVSPQRGPRPR